MATYSTLSIQNIIIGGSGSRKTNAFLSLINNETDVHKQYIPIL